MTQHDRKAPSLRETVLVLIAMATTTIVALYGIPPSLQSALSLGGDQVENLAGPLGEIDTRSPVYPIAEQVGHSVFASRVVHCDGTAVVPVADQRGFRILLQRDKNRGHRDFTTRNDWEFADLVLVPTGNLPAPPVSTIAWETEDPKDQMRSVYMGSGYGFHWYGHMALPQQDQLRVAMNLQGGEDRFTLLTESIEHATNRHERGYAIRHIAYAFGEQALPILLREIRENKYDTSDFAIHALGTVGTEESLTALLALYEDPATQRRARAALAGSYHPMAKSVYFDNLTAESPDKPYYLSSIRAILQHGWTDSIPLLEAIKDAPYTPRYYIDSSLAIRHLNGNPMPDELKTHQQVIRDLCCGSRPDEVENAYQALLAHPDQDAVLLMAIKLATSEGKGSRRPSEMGIAMLKTLPRADVLPVLDHLRTTLYDVRAQDLLSDIYNQVKGLDMRNVAQRTDIAHVG